MAVWRGNNAAMVWEVAIVCCIKVARCIALIEKQNLLAELVELRKYIRIYYIYTHIYIYLWIQTTYTQDRENTHK